MKPLAVTLAALLSGCATTPEPEPIQLTAEKLQVRVFALEAQLRKLETENCRLQQELDTITANIDLFLQE